ncbi:hypothetical protein C1646_752838 [Rhizophagus diaphanus]|nr:hypothetical protein C1646_752838 [Rhizophagus diaphanus] [Rhizophagus sp. MUCL 43196]
MGEPVIIDPQKAHDLDWDLILQNSNFFIEESMKRLALDNAFAIAKERGGTCVSTEYINASTPVRWKFNRPLTIENAKQLACNRNGICLSKYFTNSHSALLWECAKGHLWTASFSSVKHSNSWCPFCSKYKREKLCQEIVSKYLGPPSKIRRLDFLKTPKYYQGLELDIPYYDYGFAI